MSTSVSSDELELGADGGGVQIFSYCDVRTILIISRFNKALYAFLHTKTSQGIWVQAWKNSGYDKTFVAEGWNEAMYAALIYDNDCQVSSLFSLSPDDQYLMRLWSSIGMWRQEQASMHRAASQFLPSLCIPCCVSPSRLTYRTRSHHIRRCSDDEQESTRVKNGKSRRMHAGSTSLVLDMASVPAMPDYDGQHWFLELACGLLARSRGQSCPSSSGAR
jgi:hypothetical protein